MDPTIHEPLLGPTELRVPDFGPVMTPGALPEPPRRQLRTPAAFDPPPTTAANAAARAQAMATMHGLEGRDLVTAREVAATPSRDPRRRRDPHPPNGRRPRVSAPPELPLPSLSPVLDVEGVPAGPLAAPEPVQPGEIVGPNGEERVDGDERGAALRRQLGLPERTPGESAGQALRRGTVLQNVIRAGVNRALPQGARPRVGETPEVDPVSGEIQRMNAAPR
jgi:hypothetical protein